jgi:glycosyltransferase involved in cell wall biosynthesis
MFIDFINGMSSTERFGMSKYRTEITKRIKGIEYQDIEYSNKSWIPGVNKLYELVKYPLVVRKKAMHQHIQHITRQDLAFMRARIQFVQCVITCFDIIPISYYNVDFNKNPIWKENVKGLQEADHIITISEFSKQDIIKHLEVDEANISVIPPAVDHELYFPKRSKAILEKYDINSDEKVILYVGAEEPRKNLPMLIDALWQLKTVSHINFKLIKVGKSNWHGNVRAKLMLDIKDRGMEDDVIFTGYVPESELPLLYNAADIFVFPSLYEGFGMPPLEAMACGTPTIVLNSSSLPEVVGDGAVISKGDAFWLSADMEWLLKDECQERRAELIDKGITQAKKFTWESAAIKTKEVYDKLASE